MWELIFDIVDELLGGSLKWGLSKFGLHPGPYLDSAEFKKECEDARKAREVETLNKLILKVNVWECDNVKSNLPSNPTRLEYNFEKLDDLFKYECNLHEVKTITQYIDMLCYKYKLLNTKCNDLNLELFRLKQLYVEQYKEIQELQNIKLKPVVIEYEAQELKMEVEQKFINMENEIKKLTTEKMELKNELQDIELKLVATEHKDQKFRNEIKKQSVDQQIVINNLTEEKIILKKQVEAKTNQVLKLSKIKQDLIGYVQNHNTKVNDLLIYNDQLKNDLAIAENKYDTLKVKSLEFVKNFDELASKKDDLEMFKKKTLDFLKKKNLLREFNKFSVVDNNNNNDNNNNE